MLHQFGRPASVGSCRQATCLSGDRHAWMHCYTMQTLWDTAIRGLRIAVAHLQLYVNVLLSQQAGLNMLPVNTQGPDLAPDTLFFSASSITGCWSADRGAHPVCQQQLDLGRDRGHLPVSSGWLSEEGSAEVSGWQLSAGVRSHRSWQNCYCRGSSRGRPCSVSLSPVPCFLHPGYASCMLCSCCKHCNCCMPCHRCVCTDCCMCNGCCMCSGCCMCCMCCRWCVGMVLLHSPCLVHRPRLLHHLQLLLSCCCITVSALWVTYDAAAWIMAATQFGLSIIYGDCIVVAIRQMRQMPGVC